MQEIIFTEKTDMAVARRMKDFVLDFDHIKPRDRAYANISTNKSTNKSTNNSEKRLSAISVNSKRRDSSQSEVSIKSVKFEEDIQEFNTENIWDNGSGEHEEDDIETQSRRIMSTIRMMDNFLIVWHSIFLILCLCLLILGAVMKIYFFDIMEFYVKAKHNFLYYEPFVKLDDIPPNPSFGNLNDVLGESLIVLSIIYMLCVICYMTFLLHRITYTIPVVVITAAAVVLVEVNIINIYMSPASGVNNDAKKSLKIQVEGEYYVNAQNSFSIIYDLVSIWGECCGVVDQYDFQNSHLKFSIHHQLVKNLLVAPTCCRPYHFEKGTEDVLDCAEGAEGIFVTGCYQTLYIWLKKYCDLFSVVVVLQLIDSCIHTILYKKYLSLLKLEMIFYQENFEFSL